MLKIDSYCKDLTNSSMYNLLFSELKPGLYLRDCSQFSTEFLESPDLSFKAFSIKILNDLLLFFLLLTKFGLTISGKPPASELITTRPLDIPSKATLGSPSVRLGINKISRESNQSII